MISLDVFDTAIFRDVYRPIDIFQLVEEKVGGDFARLRKEAENKASAKQRFYEIADIYRHLIGFDPQVEIDMEFNHIYPNMEILEMYNKNPKNYVFISDMYLSSKTIKKMLEKCGYKNPRVFVSCEEKCNKGSGVLFEKVQRRIGKLEYHYGDNYKSDIEGCLKQDIKPVFKAALHKQPLNLPAVKNPLLKKYAAALEVSNERPLTKLTKWFAPLIYDFTKWVVQNRKPGQHIYFLSRDMFMPYIIASRFMKTPDVHYLYCSRRSLAPLFLASKEKPLLDKMKTVLTPEELKQKTDTKECINYLRMSGIRDNDILVDIGYSGSTQCIIEKFLNIKLQGMYMQLDQVNKGLGEMNMSMYLDRFALMYRFLAEFILTSPEDCVEDYSNGYVVMREDNTQRKEYAKDINKIILDERLYRRIDRMNLSVFDVEQMIIHIQMNPSDEMLKILNEPILTNRTKQERCINFDKRAILNGKLIECYKRSYARPLFKRMCANDPDTASLIDLLPE